MCHIGYVVIEISPKSPDLYRRPFESGNILPGKESHPSIYLILESLPASWTLTNLRDHVNFIRRNDVITAANRGSVPRPVGDDRQSRVVSAIDEA